MKTLRSCSLQNENLDGFSMFLQKRFVSSSLFLMIPSTVSLLRLDFLLLLVLLLRDRLVLLLRDRLLDFDRLRLRRLFRFTFISFLYQRN